MGALRQLRRLPLAVFYLIVGGLVINLAVLWDQIRGNPVQQGAARAVQALWCKGFCRALGIRLRVEGGAIQPPPVLTISNHVSWLDIVVVAAHWPVAFLSKSEVARWPIIGRCATGLGTLYIERGRRDAASRAVESMVRRLDDGDRVLFFPEGTTGEGHELLPFRPRLYQAAVDAQAPVQPLALRYLNLDGSVCTEAPFVGDDGLVSHVARMCALPGVEAVVSVGEAIVPPHERRSELALQTREQIAEALAGMDAVDGAPELEVERQP
ncbi:1-acyl-sn-glycerol-3-phosphate acyltransferase [Ectothiorhodospiraceae bacterium WFHF3C12]|nr:1-acyl-sn-glycerol-3-phosphate acyltransferase [Ectothiorhodospiraceae bacterium WFHF3C12]